MDFHERQQQARVKTGFLAVLLAGSVAATLAVIYLAVATIVAVSRDGPRWDLWDPDLAIGVCGFTLALVRRWKSSTVTTTHTPPDLLITLLRRKLSWALKSWSITPCSPESGH